MDLQGKGPVIVGVGNPLVDVLAHTGAEVVDRHGLTPGGMHLVDADAAAALYAEIGPGERQSGGSVANTVAHLSGEAVAPVFIGKIGKDALGDVFDGEFRALDIAFDTPRHETAETGRCVVIVTPDGERTMSTHLGAAQVLAPSDVTASMPSAADLVFIEGYLWDSPEGPAVIAEAVKRAQAMGAAVAMTPSDAGCVERHLDEMRAFIEGSADIVVGNVDEMNALSGASSAQAALRWVRNHVGSAAVTASAEGSFLSDAAGTGFIPAQPVAEVVDSTGAGDAYAAGLLAGLAQGEPILTAAERATELGARVVGHTGARLKAAA